MFTTEYIIVGNGLASIAFCEQLRYHGKDFVVFDDKSQQSSLAAAGIYNPVILKRFTPVWNAKEQLDITIPMYSKIQKRLQIKIIHPLAIFRRFASIEEQNMWFNATDKYSLAPFLSSKLVKNQNEYINAPFGFGEVFHAGRINTNALINAHRKYLNNNNCLFEETFDYDSINLNKGLIRYKNITAKHIIFAEGFGVKKNPFFNNVPINGTKGEVLTIKAPSLKINYAVKSSVFIIPIGEDLYQVGSTYNWTDTSNTPTEAGKKELLQKLKTFLNCDFEIVNHLAGIRPTVKDRRPIVGQHPIHKNIYILNGLGTRGVMIGPYVAQKLYEYIENKVALDKEIDIRRFD